MISFRKICNQVQYKGLTFRIYQFYGFRQELEMSRLVPAFCLLLLVSAIMAADYRIWEDGINWKLDPRCPDPHAEQDYTDCQHSNCTIPGDGCREGYMCCEKACGGSWCVPEPDED